MIYTDLGVMASVSTPCEFCEGKRFLGSVLEYTLGGRDISEVLALSVAEAEAETFFSKDDAHTPAAHADWIIDRGPGAGHDGGSMVFEGTPEDLIAAQSTLTGEHPAAYVTPTS